LGVSEDGGEIVVGDRLSCLIVNAVLLCSKYMLMFKMKAKKVCIGGRKEALNGLSAIWRIRRLVGWWSGTRRRETSQRQSVFGEMSGA
jgi:hypothetical protein